MFVGPVVGDDPHQDASPTPAAVLEQLQPGGGGGLEHPLPGHRRGRWRSTARSSSTACASELHDARKFGQYRLLQKIGAGGMGEVYLAEHQLLKRPCALKLIRPEAGSDPLALARFEREVQSAARLSHPNSIEIYDYGHADDGTFYYVMEFLPGMSLEDLVKKAGPAAAGPGDLPAPPGLRRAGRGPRDAAWSTAT